MKKGYVLAIVLILVLVLAISSVVSAYNGLVDMNEKITGSWAQVENQLQRRFDLIPNLVETVKGYAAHEREAIEAVTSARAQLAGGGLSEQERITYENELSGAVSRLLVVVENYPDLKADGTFLTLMDQLEGAENRLAQERRRFNENVQEYNAAIRRFPTMFIANTFGFGERAYFQAPEEASETPAVSFD